MLSLYTEKCIQERIKCIFSLTIRASEEAAVDFARRVPSTLRNAFGCDILSVGFAWFVPHMGKAELPPSTCLRHALSEEDHHERFNQSQ